MIKKIKQLIKQNKLIGGVLIISLILRITGLIPNIPYADEAHIQVYSWKLAENIITNGDFNPQTFKYGSLIFYYQTFVALPVFIILYVLESLKDKPSIDISTLPIFFDEVTRKYDTVFLLAGRLSIALLGVISVGVIYLIGNKLFNKHVGLLAALLLSIAPMHVRESHYMITDVFYTLTLLISVLFLVYLIDTKKRKWFFWAGIALGISSTIRYFPIAMLVYPLALIFTFNKNKDWLKKVLLSIGGLAIGLFIGIPYFFLNSNGPELLIKDLQTYALPWYGSGISDSILTSIFSILTGTRIETQASQLLYPAPEGFRPLHASWILFNGIGVIPTVFSLIGIITVLIVSFRKFLLLIVIPLITFVYISFFVPAIYEKLSLPVHPFLILFSSAGIYTVHLFLKKHASKFALYMFSLLFVLTGILPQLTKSFNASVACGESYIQEDSFNWVNNNIADNSKLAYLGTITVPSVKPFEIYQPLDPKKILSLEEARSLGVDYVFLNAERIDRETFQYFNDYFFIPDQLYMNSYYFLSLAEYLSQSHRLAKIEKPLMCDITRLYYFKLPQKAVEVENKLTFFNFSNKEETDNWILQKFEANPGIYFEEHEGKTEKGSIIFRQQDVKLTPPRLRSPEIEVKEGKTYTVSVQAKTNTTQNRPVIYLRLDFYDQANTQPSVNLAKLLSAFKHGSTPLYFEENYEMATSFWNRDLPGRVALSPRESLTNDWKKLSITTQAPANSKKAIISIQNFNMTESDVYLDDVEILEN